MQMTGKILIRGHFESFNPFANDKRWDSPKLKEFADDNSEVDENGGKFSERVENAVGKGEIAHYDCHRDDKKTLKAF